MKNLNKRAQSEESGHWSMKWFIQNIVIWIIVIAIIAYGLYRLLAWLTSF